MRQAPASSAFDSAALAEQVRKKRGRLGVRAAAAQIEGVSSSTLSRVENGHVPDLDTYIRLCRWLGVSPSAFIAQDEADTDKRSTPDIVAAHFRADRALDAQTAESLSAAMRALYDAAIQGKL